MVLPPSNNPAGNPCSEHGRQTHHYVGIPSVYSLFPQCAKCDGTTSRLHTHLLREQHLLPGHFLSGPHSRPHHCNSRPQHPNRLVPATHSSFLSGTGERAVESNEILGPARHGPGPALQGQSRRVPGSTRPRGRHDPGAPPQHPKLCADDRALPWNRRSPLESDGAMASSR